MGMMGLGPAIRLRYGDLALSLRCSPRDDAAACADAALKVIDRLRQTPPGEGGQGGAEREDEHGDASNGENDHSSDDGDNGDDQQ